MNEQNQKNTEVEDHLSSQQGDRHRGASSPTRRFFRKKWVFPAAYMAAAAIILSIMWIYQGSNQHTIDETELGLNVVDNSSEEADFVAEEALPVTTPAETMQLPVSEEEAVEVVTPFYDTEASEEDKVAAMLQIDDTLMPSSGISLARADQGTFEVLAAMSGTVTRVDQVPYLGNLVEITHEDGTKTIYSSLTEVQVEENQQVVQGEVLALAGRNEMQKELGAHVHFEILKDGQPVNPETVIEAASAGQ